MEKSRSKSIYLMVIIGTAVVILIGMVRGSSGLSRYIELSKSQKILGEKVDSIKKETDALSAEISRIQSSPSYAQKVLRDRYHVTEEGEDILFFAD